MGSFMNVTLVEWGYAQKGIGQMGSFPNGTFVEWGHSQMGHWSHEVIQKCGIG